jgi:RHS repeat-associated protein
VADSSNYRVQRRWATNGQWTAWGGYGTNAGQFNAPIDVTADSNGNVYVTDIGNDRIQRLSNGVWSVFVGNGTNNGKVHWPVSVFCDGSRTLYVSDYGPSTTNSAFRIQKIDLNGSWLETIGNGSPDNGGFRRPYGVALLGANVFVADIYLDGIMFGNTGNWSVFCTTNTLRDPEDVVVDSVRKLLYIADTGHSRILQVNLFGADPSGQTNVVSWSEGGADSLSVARQFSDRNLPTNIATRFNSGIPLTQQFTWNTNWDKPASVTDPEGHLVQFDYTNGFPGVMRVFLSTNQSVDTHFTYATNGLLSAVTNANGHWTKYQYNSYGYPTSSIPQTGPTVGMTWDVLGHLKELRLPSTEYTTNDPPQMVPRVIAFDPDELGRTRRITYPDSSSETFSFDGIGNVTNHVDVAGRTNRFTWLPTRKLASTTRYLTGSSNQAVTIGLDYDQQMNVVKVRDELGRAVEMYQLDLQDRPTKVTNVESQEMTVAYGLGSMVKQMVRFDGSWIDYGYDEGARINKIVYPDQTLGYRYLKNGLLMTASNSIGVISNAYDGANRLISVATPSPSGNVGYGYYPAGQVSNVVSVAGTNSYALDGAERLVTLTASRKGLAPEAFQYSYNDVNGAVSDVAYSNGMDCSVTYDTLDRIASMVWKNVSNQVLRSRAYSYSPAGMIAEIDYETGERVVYSYDSLDRLTGEQHLNAAGLVISYETYGYDLAGNRTSKAVYSGTNPVITVNYALGTGNHLSSWTVAETDLVAQIDVAGASSETIGTNDRFGWLYVSNANHSVKPFVSGTNFWTYDLIVGLGTQKVVAAIRDGAGNMGYATNSIILTVVTNGAYQYSAAGCVTNIQYKGKSYTRTFGLTWNSQYQLTAVATNGATVERNGYDAYGRRIWTWDGSATNWMVYDGAQVSADVDLSGNLKRSYFYGPGIDNILSMTVYGSSTNTYYYLKDHLGSVLALTDKDGKVAESYRYDAWGRTTAYDGSGNAIAESAIGNRYCWQGREFSWKTGFYYFRARWYDPVAGRWLSNDPIGISGGLNQYVFCANNPVNRRDPFGRNANTISMSGSWGTADYQINYYGPGGIQAVQGVGLAGYAQAAGVSLGASALGIVPVIGIGSAASLLTYESILAAQTYAYLYGGSAALLAQYLPYSNVGLIAGYSLAPYVPLIDSLQSGFFPGPMPAVSIGPANVYGYFYSFLQPLLYALGNALSPSSWSASQTSGNQSGVAANPCP